MRVKSSNSQFPIPIQKYLASLTDEAGNPLFEVTARDRQDLGISYGNLESNYQDIKLAHCPSLVEESTSERVKQNPQILEDFEAYVRKLAF